MDIDIDVDKLCRLVEARPILWDRTVEGYRKPCLAKAAWQEIYCELFDGYLTLDELGKIKYGKAITGKWTQTRDVWNKDLKKRRESRGGDEPEPEPRPGSREAFRYERCKFLRKVYCQEEEADLSDTNLPGDFQSEGFKYSEFLSGAYPVDSEAATLPNFLLKTAMKLTKHAEKPAETITRPDLNIEKEGYEPPPKISNKHKLDFTNRHEFKKIKQETYVRPEKKSSHNKSFIGKDASEIKPSTSGSYNTVRSNTMSELKYNVMEQQMRPVTRQENLPTSSNDECGHSTQNRSTATTTPGIWENDEKSDYLRSLRPKIESFDEYQFMCFQIGVLDLIKKSKFPNRA